MQRASLLTGCLFVLAVGAVASCGDSNDAAVEAQAVTQQSAVTLPGCPPVKGNDRGVGAPCTRGGGQCKGTGAPFCTVDVQANAEYAFCTKMCWSNDQCGPDATCATSPTNPGLRGCVPNSCLP